MAAVHGKDSVFKIQNAGGALTDITAFLDNQGVAQEADPADVTTMGNQSKKYIPGLKDGKIKIEGPFDATGHTTLSGILNISRNFEYHPAGTAGGTPKATGSAILISYEVESEVGDAVKSSGELQITGDVTWGTN